MTVSQWMAMPKVIIEQQINTYPQVISAQRTDSNLMVVLQWIIMLRVVARPQVVAGLVVKSARLYRRNTLRLRETLAIYLKEERSR